MNETGIPKIFWYMISLTILSVNIGLIWLIRNAQMINLGYANTKIQIIRSVDKLEKCAKAIKSLDGLNVKMGVSAQKIDDLSELKSELDSDLEQLKAKSKEFEKSLV